MYKAIFQKMNASDINEEITQTNANLNTLLDTVFTNTHGTTQEAFVEHLCTELYKQVDGEWVRQTTGTDWDTYYTRWNNERVA